jgi:acetyl-CoA C-acetyltransferase
MASHGIKDRVAIVAMGCTPFKEHWDAGVDDLALDASNEAFAAAGLTKDDVDAYWLGTAQSAMSGITLARALQLQDKPVTRVENYCATGSEALRQAAYAVASGAYDVAMAVGVEKVKDSGYQGLNAFPIPSDGTTRTLTAAGSFSMVAPAYAEKYGVPADQLKRTLGRIASKNHHNGARNPRAQFRREMSVDQICAMPNVAGDLSVFDCAGVADGAAAAIMVRAEEALRYTDKVGPGGPRLRLHRVPRGRRLCGRRLCAGRHHRPHGADRHGRGSRLLHPDRAGAHGGPGLLRARHGVEGHRVGPLRPRR